MPATTTPEAPQVRMIPVPEPVLRGLLEYLAARPYREVAGAIPEIERLLAEPGTRAPTNER